MKTADKLCGDLVRARGRCQNGCGRTTGLQWAHGFSRRYHKVRWDLRNGFCLCATCHMRFTHNPLLWEMWLRAEWGDALYDEMRDLALKGPRADLKQIIASLRVHKAAQEAMLECESRGTADTAPGTAEPLIGEAQHG